MDPQVSTSFIPKQALAEEKARAGGIGIFMLLALIIFVLSIVAAGGAAAYGYKLNGDLASDKASLATEEGAFDPATIKDLQRMDSRLTQARTLLGNHVAPSGILDFLSQNTLQNVQFTSFQYTLEDDGTVHVQLDGVTDSFATMALQSDALGKSASLRDVIFSNITVEQSGGVAFMVQAVVDPSLISYASMIKNQAAAPQQ